MEKICLDCEKPLIGRADKKFCDDQCRTSYNNKLKVADSGVVKTINHILKKNHQILKKLNLSGKTKIKRSLLAAQGFDFGYHTHTYQTQKGHLYIFCYDEGYLPLEEQELLLVRKDLPPHG